MPLSCVSENVNDIKPVHVSTKIVEQILHQTDVFLCDMDGVLWDGAGPIQGSMEAISKLMDRGKRVFYITNSTSNSRQDFVKKLNNSGFPCFEEQVICPAYVVAQYLKHLKFKDKVYLVGLESSLGQELSRCGIRFTGTGPDATQGTLADWLALEMDPEVKCVVVGFDPHISFMKMLKACSYLKKADCLFLACHQDRILPIRGTEKCIPGTGCMVLPISHASMRMPTIIGKPETKMFEVLDKIHGFDRDRCLMIGDTLTADVAFAEKCGLRSMLVLSGVSSARDIPVIRCKNVSRGDSERRNALNEYPVPDYYASSLGEFGTFL